MALQSGFDELLAPDRDRDRDDDPARRPGDARLVRLLISGRLLRSRRPEE